MFVNLVTLFIAAPPSKHLGFKNIRPILWSWNKREETFQVQISLNNGIGDRCKNFEALTFEKNFYHFFNYGKLYFFFPTRTARFHNKITIILEIRKMYQSCIHCNHLDVSNLFGFAIRQFVFLTKNEKIQMQKIA